MNLGNAGMQSSQDDGLHLESDIIHEILLGQHKLSQPHGCRVTYQVLTENVKNSAEKAKSVHCRTPNAGRRKVETTWMTDLQTEEPQAVQTPLDQCMREVVDLTNSRESEELGQTREQAKANGQIGRHSTLAEQ